jgi:hypothetical protein
MTSPLLKEIFEELQSVTWEYGPPSKHENEEARSHYLAPVFMHVLFRLAIPHTLTSCGGVPSENSSS